MTRPSLKSRFGEQIRAFVGYKNSLGFPYDESIRILGRFDDFCVERFPEKDCLDRELALAWLEKRDTENTAGHRNRIMVIREFAKYLRAVGTEAYMIPISMTSKGPRYVPHIFNEAEIKAFFHGADSFRPHEKAPARHLVIPVFYRLLYCCGLRPAEARLLKKENVDFRKLIAAGSCFAEGEEVIDYGFVERWILGLEEKYGVEVMQVGYDRYNAISTVQKLEANSMECVEVKQHSSVLHPPTKLLREAILKKEFAYDENRLLEINFQNARCTEDTNLNKYVNKKRSAGKVDMVVSTIIAVYLMQQAMLDNSELDWGIQVI